MSRVVNLRVFGSRTGDLRGELSTTGVDFSPVRVVRYSHLRSFQTEVIHREKVHFDTPVVWGIKQKN